MRIIKEGDPDKLGKRFECENCGCIFVANKSEYEYRKCGMGEYEYVTECPYCHEEVHKYA